MGNLFPDYLGHYVPFILHHVEASALEPWPIFIASLCIQYIWNIQERNELGPICAKLNSHKKRRQLMMSSWMKKMITLPTWGTPWSASEPFWMNPSLGRVSQLATTCKKNPLQNTLG